MHEVLALGRLETLRLGRLRLLCLSSARTCSLLYIFCLLPRSTYTLPRSIRARSRLSLSLTMPLAFVVAPPRALAAPSGPRRPASVTTSSPTTNSSPSTSSSARPRRAPSVKRARPRSTHKSTATQPSSLSLAAELADADTTRISYPNLLRAVESCVNSHRYAAAVRLIDSAAAHPPLYARFTARIYSHLFLSLMKLGTRTHATRAYSTLHHVVCHMDVATMLGPRAFNFVFVALSRVGMIDEARQVAQMCYQAGYYLNRYSYNALLNACAKEQRLDVAFATLRQMAEHNVSPDVVSFNVLISCCVRVGSVDIALNILSRMKDWQIQPDIYSYNSVINGLRKSNMLDEAFELVAQMERESRSAEGSIVENGLGVAPDLVTYNTLLSALAAMDRPHFERAVRVKNHMEQRGLHCNEVSYNALMAAAAKSDRVEEAFEVYDEMISRGLKPNCECFTTLITLCGRANLLDKAFQVHEHMLASDIKPNVITYNALLTACRGCGDGDVDRALDLLEVMRNTPRCDPDVITYSTVIDVLGRNERFDEMKRLFKQMQEEGIKPNLVTYTSMIAAMTRTSRLEEAIRILQDMERHGVQPNVYTFSSLINGAAKRGDFDSAMEILDMMRSKGVRPSSITYTMLLQLAMKIGKKEIVAVVLEEMHADKRADKRRLAWLEEFLGRLDLLTGGKSRVNVKKMAELVEECIEKSPSDSNSNGL